MPTRRISLLVCFVAFDLFAARTLYLPPLRGRYDIAGSNASGSSVVFPTGPANTPIQVCELRSRYEFQNVSSDLQSVSLTARAGSYYEVSSHNNPVIARPGTDLLADTFILSFDLSAMGSQNSSNWLLLDFTCTFTSPKVGSCATSVNSIQPITATGTYPRTFTINSGSPVVDLQRDSMCAEILGINVSIAQNTGAVVATQQFVANRTGGYYETMFDSGFPINGGHPF